MAVRGGLDVVVLIPRGHSPAQSVMSLASEIHHIPLPGLVLHPVHPGRHRQGHVHRREGLARAGRAMHHDERILRQPVLDEPVNRRRLRDELDRADQRVLRPCGPARLCPVAVGLVVYQPLKVVVGVGLSHRSGRWLGWGLWLPVVIRHLPSPSRWRETAGRAAGPSQGQSRPRAPPLLSATWAACPPR